MLTWRDGSLRIELAARPPGAGPAPVTWPRVRADRSLARHRRPASPGLTGAHREDRPGPGAGGMAVAMAGHVPPALADVASIAREGGGAGGAGTAAVHDSGDPP